MIDYGIKYKVIKQKEGLYFLFPIALVKGYAVKDKFYEYSYEQIYKILNSSKDLGEEIIIDSVYSEEELKKLYNCDDLEFLIDYFESDEKDKIEIVTFQMGQIQKVKVETKLFEETDILETYELEQGKPIVTLNNAALEDILTTSTPEEMRARLIRYKSLLQAFERKEKEGITSIQVKDGNVVKIECNRQIILPKDSLDSIASKSSLQDISVVGLENYIKERVFGHDKEIRTLAKSIIMNYTAVAGEKVEPILLIGPTGTGKTETMHAINSYLNIPLIEINAANLVPQGIKGMSLEDCLYSLITSCNYDLEEAQRGIVFIDEFDKLGRVSVDYKTSVIQILLKFIEGGTFFIDKPIDDYIFDTTMLIKIVAGAFSDLFEEDKTIGFGQASSNKVFKPQSITEKEYFGKELITRIPHILVFNELSREEKKKAILFSKISEYLIKKKRYKRQFGVALQADDSYVEALLDKLSEDQKSMRELNNLIIESLDAAEYAMLAQPGKYRRLILTRRIVEDNSNFNLD